MCILYIYIYIHTYIMYIDIVIYEYIYIYSTIYVDRDYLHIYIYIHNIYIYIHRCMYSCLQARICVAVPCVATGGFESLASTMTKTATPKSTKVLRTQRKWWGTISGAPIAGWFSSGQSQFWFFWGFNGGTQFKMNDNYRGTPIKMKNGGSITCKECEQWWHVKGKRCLSNKVRVVVVFFHV